MKACYMTAGWMAYAAALAMWVILAGVVHVQMFLHRLRVLKNENPLAFDLDSRLGGRDAFGDAKYYY